MVVLTSIEKIRELHNQLVENVLEIDKIGESIDVLEANGGDMRDYEYLYANEFKLKMDHIGIVDDLLNYIDQEPRTLENKFELAKLKRDTKNLLRVAVMEF